MFRRPFNVYGAVITFKKLNEIKHNEKIFPPHAILKTKE